MLFRLYYAGSPCSSLVIIQNMDRDSLFCTLTSVMLGNMRCNAVCISILRKSQAQKFNSSIEDFEKQKSQTVKVLRDAIAEMKAYIDKELETVSKF